MERHIFRLRLSEIGYVIFGKMKILFRSFSWGKNKSLVDSRVHFVTQFRSHFAYTQASSGNWVELHVLESVYERKIIKK